MNIYKLKWVLFVDCLIALVYLIVIYLLGSSNVETVSEPNYHKALFKSEKELQHIESEKTDISTIVSIYNYNNFDYGILLFRKKTAIKFIDSLVVLKNETTVEPSNQFYKGSIFKNKLRYKFNDNKEVNKVTVYLNDYNNNKNIVKKTPTSLYMSFSLNSLVGLNINNEDKLTFYAKGNSNKEEFNELMIKIKDGYVYFIYVKPISRYSPMEKLLPKILK